MLVLIFFDAMYESMILLPMIYNRWHYRYSIYDLSGSRSCPCLLTRDHASGRVALIAPGT